MSKQEIPHFLEKIGSYPSVHRICEHVLNVFPEHIDVLSASFDCPEDHLLFAELLASQVLAIVGDSLVDYAKGYAWLCRTVLHEELHFRKTGEYRLSSFEDACSQVYQNTEIMTPYMRGLLLSQVLWSNHRQVFRFYRDNFLHNHAADVRHLEIGPGHGLFLSFAAANKRIGSLEAWDISESSLRETRLALDCLGVTRPIHLLRQDMFDAEEKFGAFDSIVFSEVLEHLDSPREALDILRRIASNNAKLFINAPANSPAPDHIHLFADPADVGAMVREAGFAVEMEALFPATGSTLERARRRRIAVSACIIARPA